MYYYRRTQGKLFLALLAVCLFGLLVFVPWVMEAKRFVLEGLPQ